MNLVTIMSSTTVFRALSKTNLPYCKRCVSTAANITNTCQFLPTLATRSFTASSTVHTASRLPRRQISTSAILREGIYSVEEKKTFIRNLNKEEGSPLMVDTISRVGFRLNNGLFAHGPIALFARSVLSWRVSTARDITPDSLALFLMLAPKIDVLVLGVGDPGQRVAMETIMFLRSQGLVPEVLPSEKAIAAFNFLNEEGRSVAAGLIPPPSMDVSASDYVQTLADRNQLWIEKEQVAIDPLDETHKEIYRPTLNKKVE